MKIYWIKAQAPRRVLAVVKHLGIDAELIEIDAAKGGLRAPDYKALNPNMKTPTLVDGDLVLWESSAIMAHLAIQAGSDLWPAHNPAEQVEVLRWLSWNDCHWLNAVGKYYLEFIVKPQFGLGEPDEAVLTSAAKPFMSFAKVLDAHLAGRTHVACGRLTIADFQLASMACYWREARMPMEGFPNIVRWLDALDAIPAWKDPWPAPG
ncbi:MAG: glutathione S-transferase family protein [Betaproteobacteria bacterium]|nr:glutathione S-transferase family protein [Betaproteobacteria bacterium]